MIQPPPRGCVLKHVIGKLLGYRTVAAASVRLCVETGLSPPIGRLRCLETIAALRNKTEPVNSQFLYGGVERLVSVCVL